MYNLNHGGPTEVDWIGKQADRIADTWANLWCPSKRSQPYDKGTERSILSIGCGYAQALSKYSERGWTVFGIDPDPAAIDWNRKHIQGEFFNAPFEDFEFDRRFDAIHSSALIEHTYDPLGFVKKANSLLNPGGELFLFTPNAGGAITRAMGRYSIATWIPFHLVLFTVAGMKALCQRANMQAEVSTMPEPHLASLSVRQWRNRNKLSFGLQKGWDTRATTMLTSPIWAVLNRFELGEELYVRATSTSTS